MVLFKLAAVWCVALIHKCYTLDPEVPGDRGRILIIVTSKVGKGSGANGVFQRMLNGSQVPVQQVNDGFQHSKIKNVPKKMGGLSLLFWIALEKDFLKLLIAMGIS